MTEIKDGKIYCDFVQIIKSKTSRRIGLDRAVTCAVVFYGTDEYYMLDCRKMNAGERWDIVRRFCEELYPGSKIVFDNKSTIFFADKPKQEEQQEETEQ